jgi:exosortase
MIAPSPTRPAPPSPQVRGSAALWLMLASLALLWGIVIHQIGAQWSVYEQYAYGWAVPFLCAYLAWRAWENIRRKFEIRNSKFEIRMAFASVIFCALLFFPTRIVVEANPIWRAASYAISIEVIAITLGLLYLVGGRQSLKAFAFPVCFFLVAVPWPSAIENLVIQSLTRLNTGATVELLGMAGTPALQHGNVIEISTGMVGIDEACSGVRSVQATLMMTLFFGAFYQLSWKRRLKLIGIGFALALICNLGRTFFLASVAARDGLPAMEKWHDPAGVTILVTCFLGIWLGAEVLRKVESKKEKFENKNAENQKTGIGRQKSEAALEKATALSHLNFPFRFFKIFAGSLLAWILFSEGATQFWFLSHERNARASMDWTVNWPTNQSEFRQIPIPRESQKELQCNEGFHYGWRDDDGIFWQSFYLKWNPASTLKERATVHLAKTHRPEHCLTAAGKTLEMETEPRVLTLGNLKLPYRGMVFEDRGRPMHVFFIAWEEDTPGDVYANMRSDTMSRLEAAMSGTRGKGQRVMEVAAWGFADYSEAENAFKKTMQKIIVVK